MLPKKELGNSPSESCCQIALSSCAVAQKPQHASHHEKAAKEEHAHLRERGHRFGISPRQRGNPARKREAAFAKQRTHETQNRQYNGDVHGDFSGFDRSASEAARQKRQPEKRSDGRTRLEVHPA